MTTRTTSVDNLPHPKVIVFDLDFTLWRMFVKV